MKKLTLKRNTPHPHDDYPSYTFFYDQIPFFQQHAPKRYISNRFKRYKIGFEKIPKDAKILLTKQDRIPYDQKFLGGFVCNKLGFTYGIYLAAIDSLLTRPDECIFWELTKDEIERFTNYDTNQKGTR